jgi:AraC family transcriptional regulator, regulatory protein of adaptative response / DNA-3-methyladenine glycosylase II
MASDATRVVANGSYRAAIRVDGEPEQVRAWQRADGVVCVRAESDGGVEHVRFALGLDDDHSEFLRRFATDPLLAEPIRRLRGLRPVRTATVAHALLRAVAGQLILSSRAREIEQTIVRRASPALDGLHAAPSCDDLARFAPAELRNLGLGARRGASLVRICRSLELEKLKALPTEAAAARLARERGLGPWSVGVVCLQGLGRYEYGLARDLGLVKLAAALWGRRVEAEETDELLAPYEEWAGLASVYLLAGHRAGLVVLSDADRDSRRRQDRRVAPRRAA